MNKKIAEDHVLIRVTEGSGLGGSIVPTCTCGWKGRPEYNHNDWQFNNLNEQEDEHKRSIWK